MSLTGHPLLQATGIFLLVIAFVGPSSYAVYFGWNWRNLEPEYKFPIKVILWLAATFGFVCFVVASLSDPNSLESKICLGVGLWFLAIPILVGFSWDCHELSDWEGAALRRIHGIRDDRY